MADEREMHLLLVMPAGHNPDWSAASALVAAISDETLAQLAPACSAILDKRVVLPTAVLRQRLHDALAELHAAMRGALLPNQQDHRERHVLGNADVLMEPHPRERRTFLATFIELLDHVGALDVLGCEALCAPEVPLAQAILESAPGGSA